MKNGIFVIFFFTGIIFFSCKNGKTLKTPTGLKYILYTESSGPKAAIGDYVTVWMVYKNDQDSVIFDSRKSDAPLRFRLDKIPFSGSFEEGLTYLSVNDSATFFVAADSLYHYLYLSRKAGIIPQEKTAFTKGSYIKFDIKLLNIQNETAVEEDMMMKMSGLEKRERVDISHYIDRMHITTIPDTSGYYLLMHTNGKGASIDSGKVVTVEYEGRFLNDSVFDGTKKAGRPYRFLSGAHHIIKGWEYAMKKMREGDKFTLLLPSRLAYGESGIQNPDNGKFIVPPFTPVVFDMNIISVDDAPAVSGK